ncbi:hypothetical protein ASG67_16680 [Sphingomonas sp. Leaf339]|uniref:TadE/TadG family type IV pilus assembly protein n=1 Tax=Sphingomonas sp. Leaf339 TaxID=1736343 RepID=UPI0006F5880C|nr:TadE/TadG family type IV pilus assembly protein [Sphingomonas sp. Leaf339]KQU59162.1 hypothetical protein ASG67_16680 [Sphingomonas sp. Leaf339]
MIANPCVLVIRRLARDRRGTTLIEFAILLPVLLMLYLGGFQMIDASACKRRVTITARALADLVSQYATISTTEMSGIVNASSQIMAPYDASTAQIRISQVSIDANKNASITWSYAKNMSPFNNGQGVIVPSGLSVANSSIIYSEVTYPYDPVIAWVTGSMSFKQTQFMLPRRSAKITYPSS